MSESSRQHPFEKALEAGWPPSKWSEVTILVAVSGGADSVALLRAVQRLKTGGAGRIVIAHFNHRWRGNESDGDEQFVRNLCRSLKLKLVVGRARQTKSSATTAASERREAAARHLRYRFLASVANRLGARYVATAHTADDQAETVLQRILRGTGLAGLAGIPRIRQLTPAATLIRPMLAIGRAEVRDYLHALGQDFREDSSNLNTKYIRNRIRHELLPLARECYSEADHALQRLAALAAEAQAVISRQVAILAERAVRQQSPNLVVIDAAMLTEADPYLIRELLLHVWQHQRWPQQAMTFHKWNELAQMLRSAAPEPQTTIFPGRIRAEKRAGLLTLTRL